MSKGYKTGVWSGIPNYECEECDFSNPDEARVKKHVFDRHRRVRQRPSLILGPDGKTLIRAEPKAEEVSDE